MEDRRGEAREVFAARMTELLGVARLPYDRVARRAMESRRAGESWSVTGKQISTWKQGDHVPRNICALRAVVRALIGRVRGDAEPQALTAGLLDEDSWVRWWNAAREAPRAAVPSDRAALGMLPQVSPPDPGVDRGVPRPWAVTGNVIQGRDGSASAPAVLPAAVWGLPAQPVFVGREAELAWVAEALAPAADNARVTVSAVAGLAGAGKTAIAVRAAHDAINAGWFPGGVLMVDLHGYDAPERRVQPAAALASLLGALGIPREHIPAEQADRERLWRTVLDTGRRMLIVADNASSSEQVRPLVPARGGHQVVVTSRHTLADLEGARLLDVDVLPAGQGAELLRQALAAAHPGDDRVLADPGAARQLAQLCGGLPLAVRILAALLAADPGQPVAELAQALTAEHRRLEELDYDCRSTDWMGFRHPQRRPLRRPQAVPGTAAEPARRLRTAPADVIKMRILRRDRLRMD